MEFEMKSKVYIKTDDAGCIIRCEGGYTTPSDLTGWIYIDEGTGDKYNLCQSHYFDGGLYTYDYMPRYKYEDGQVQLRTEEEIEADRKIANTPTIGQQIESLKQQLSSTDYKIIKCSEAQLLGDELPYDISSLHTERQALRDKINELEAKLEVSSESNVESNVENNQEGGAS